MNVEVRSDGVVNSLRTPNGGRGGIGSADAVLTFDARGNGEGAVTNALTGDHQNRVTDYTAIVLRNREGKPGGGKGPVVTMASGQANAEIVSDGSPSLTLLHEQPIAFVPYGVPRRLTPVECERLMGWPDGWTDVPDERGKPAPDTARYKACGNGVASPVAAWIGFRLRAALEGMAPDTYEVRDV